MNKFQKSLLTGIFLLCCSTCLSTAAKDIQARIKTDTEPQKTFSDKQLMEVIQEEIKNGSNEDVLLEMLLRIPYEKRQYYFPFIHEEIFLSHKLKSHPDILFWKNKKPTLIAPQLKEFSQKHLNDLPASLYPFLDPDFWAPPAPEKKINLYGIDLNTAPLPAFKTTDYVYPNLQSLFKLSPQVIENYTKTDLTNADISKVSHLLNHFDDYAKKLKDKDKTQQYLRALNSQFMRISLADPFAIFAQNIEKIGEKESFNSFVKENGFKNTADFVDKSDRILKAYRAQNLNPLLAIQFNHIRADMPKDKKKIDSTQMYARMFEAHPADIYFVAKHTKELEKAFPKDNLMYWGIPIYID